MEQFFKRTMDSLDLLFDFLNQFRSNHPFDQRTGFALQLAIEEVFTNFIKYNKGSSDILVGIEKDNDTLRLTLQDFDVDNFDVANPPAIDPKAPLEERRVGGLGLYLVHKIMDQVEYQYANRVSRVTMIKKIGEDLCSK